MGSTDSASANKARLSLWQFYKTAALRAADGQFERARWWQAVAALAVGLACTIASFFIAGGWSTVSAALTAIGWLPFVVFAAVFLWGLTAALLRAPHEMYQEEVARAEAAEVRLNDALAGQRPKVEFHTEERDAALIVERKKREGVLFKIGFIPVRNVSTKDGADVRVSLIEFQSVGQRAVPVRRDLLSDSRGLSAVRIAAQTTDHFRLVRFHRQNNQAFLMPEGDGGELGGNPINPGTYKLELRITPYDGLPVTGFYLLEVSANGGHQLHLWQDNEALRTG